MTTLAHVSPYRLITCGIDQRQTEKSDLSLEAEFTTSWSSPRLTHALFLYI